MALRSLEELQDARARSAVLNDHTAHTPTPTGGRDLDEGAPGLNGSRRFPSSSHEEATLPHNGRGDSKPTAPPPPGGHKDLPRTTAARRTHQRINWDASTPPTNHNGQQRGHQLLRKEVIQPHLPVRLPCYDFTPLADPTFDGSLHKGWATGFGCCRLSWCDGRCVQGPGTYSPRRC